MSQVSLLSWNTKVPLPFHVGVRYCRGLILASQWPCSLCELQSFIYRSDSTWPSLCASVPFFYFFLVREKADLDPVLRLLLPGPVHLSVWWCVYMSDRHSMRCRASLFPSCPRVYPPFLPSFYFCRSPCLSLSLLWLIFKRQFLTCHPPRYSPTLPRSGADTPVLKVAVCYAKNR